MIEFFGTEANREGNLRFVFDSAAIEGGEARFTLTLPEVEAMLSDLQSQFGRYAYGERSRLEKIEALIQALDYHDYLQEGPGGG